MFRFFLTCYPDPKIYLLIEIFHHTQNQNAGFQMSFANFLFCAGLTPRFSTAFPLGQNTFPSQTTLCLYLVELCGTCVTPSLPSLPPSPPIPFYLCVLTFDLCPVGFPSSLFTALDGSSRGRGTL